MGTDGWTVLSSVCASGALLVSLTVLRTQLHDRRREQLSKISTRVVDWSRLLSPRPTSTGRAIPRYLDDASSSPRISVNSPTSVLSLYQWPRNGRRSG